MTKIPNVIDYLKGRGIAPETGERYEITATVFSNRPALMYPTRSGDVSCHRIKFTDGVKPKNSWRTKRPSELRYYDTGTLQEVIKGRKGVLWWLNGEPAVWAFHSYLVAKNPKAAKVPAFATCSFGENILPDDMVGDLKSWGVKTLIVPVDSDSHGLTMALKLMNMEWHASGIELLAIKPQYDITEDNGKDFNDLWLDVKCNPAAMDELITNAQGLTREFITEQLARFAPPAADTENTMQQAFRVQTAASSRVLDGRALFAEWVDSIILALGTPAKKEGRVLRYHCPIHSLMGRGNDDDPSLRIDTHKSPPRPYCSCGIHNRNDAWDLIASTVNVPSWNDFKQARAQTARSRVGINQAPPVDNTESIAERRKRVFVSTADALRETMRAVRGDVSDIGEPAIYPLRALHKLGGLCHVIPAGKLIGISGGSGDAKTQLTETQVDFENRMGLSSVVFGPEWTPVEMMQRRIQRYTGETYWDQQNEMNIATPHVTVEKLTLWTLWLKEKELGIPEEDRLGVALTADEQAEVERVTNLILSWPAQSYYIHESSNKTPDLYVEDMLEMLADHLSDLRAQKIRANRVYVDYHQLLEMKDPPKKDPQIAIMKRLKTHCITHRYVCFDVTQSNKAAQAEQRSNKRMLTSGDAHFLRDDMANLWISLNRVYRKVKFFDEKSNQTVTRHEPTNRSRLLVSKNSLAKSQQVVELEIDFDHLVWIDEY